MDFTDIHTPSKETSSGTSHRTSNMFSTTPQQEQFEKWFKLWLPCPWTADLHNKGTLSTQAHQGKSTAWVVQLEVGSEWLQTPVEVFQRWPANHVKWWTDQKPVTNKPLSLPRACLAARIAGNLGQSVLSRVQLLSFVYFYILQTTQLPRLLLPSSLLANFNTQPPS